MGQAMRAIKNDLHIFAHVGSAHILGVFCLEVQEGASVDHVAPKRLYGKHSSAFSAAKVLV